MNRNLSLLLAFFLFFVACKKDSKPTPTPGTDNDKLQKVTFSISGFSQAISPFQTNNQLKTNSTTAANDVVLDLKYLLYSSSGKFIRQLTFVSNKGLVDNLALGDYTAIFISGVGIDGVQITPDSVFYNNRGYFYFPEIYYKKIHFSVSTTNNNLNVQLSHLNAQIKVVIKDAIPANVAKIELVYNELFQSYLFKTDVFKQIVVTDPEPYSEDTGPLFITKTISLAVTPGIKNATLTTLSTNVGKPFSITLNCYTSTGAYVLSKLIGGINCQSNTVTLVSGDLFNNTAGTPGVSAKPDTTWNVSTNTIHF